MMRLAYSILKLTLMINKLSLHFNIYSISTHYLVSHIILAHDWFLEIAFVCNVSMHVCMCPPLRLLITSGVLWCDKKPL